MTAIFCGIITGILLPIAYYIGKFKGAKEAFDKMHEELEQEQTFR